MKTIIIDFKDKNQIIISNVYEIKFEFEDLIIRNFLDGDQSKKTTRIYQLDIDSMKIEFNY